MSERVHTAGLAFKLLSYGMLFAMASLLFIILDPAVTELLAAGASTTSSTQAANGHSYLSSAWTYLPVFTAMLAVIMIIAGAVGESRGPA